MQRRDVAILASALLAGGAALVGIFTLPQVAWQVLIAVLLVVTAGIVSAISLTLYQRRYSARVKDEAQRLDAQMQALQAVRRRKQRDEELRALLEQQKARIEGWIHGYLQGLRNSPDLSRIQILDMSMPTDLMAVYVQLRLRQDDRWWDEMHSALLRTEGTHDPNSILRTSLQEIEQRAGLVLGPDEAIARFKHCVILGGPGAGKTTLLKYLTIRAAGSALEKSSATMPVHIDLYTFANSGEKDLLSFMAIQWDGYGFPRAEALKHIQKILEDGTALVLLDALDESLMEGSAEQAEASYARVSQAILHLAQTYPATRVVVTARVAGYQQRLPLVNFKELEILEFSPGDIKQFIDKWFACHTEEFKDYHPNDLMAELRQTAALHTFATRPLLLAMIVILFVKRRGKLPDKRAELYRRCVEVLFQAWEDDKERKLFYEFTREDNEQLLLHIAWHYHKRRKRSFPTTDLLRQIGDFLPKISLSDEVSEKILDEISLRTGLLVKPATGWYAFLHLTIQEYFAALMADDRELLTHLRDPWWEEVILLYVSHVKDASPFIQALFNEKEYVEFGSHDPLFYYHLVLAGRCLGAKPTLDKDLRDKIVNKMLEKLCSTRYSLTRQQLAEALAAMNNAAVNDRLIAMLHQNEEQPEVLVSLARALGLYGDHQVMEALLSVLFDERANNEVRVCIAQMVGAATMHSAAPQVVKDLIPQLVRGLKNRMMMNYQVRLSIATTLSAFIDEEFAPQVFDLLNQPRMEAEIRCALVDALGKSGLPSLIPHLYQIYRAEGEVSPGSTFFWHTAIALAALGEVEELNECLSWLKPGGSSGSRPDFYIMLKVDIIHALGALRLPILARPFLEMLSDERIHWEIRVAVASALEALDDRQLARELVPLIARQGSIDSRVRAAIATVVGSLGDQHYIKPMQRLYIQLREDPRVYRSVVTAIGSLGELAMIPLLSNWLRPQKESANPAADPLAADDRSISVAERLNILDALQRLYMLDRLQARDRQKLFATFRSIVVDKKEDSALRKRVLFLLPSSVYEGIKREQVETLLIQLLSDEEIFDEVHHALWIIRRRWQGKPRKMS